MIRSRWSTAVRLSIGLTGVTVTLVFGAHLLGFVPDTEGVVLEGRKRLCETIAVQCAVAAERGDVAPIRAVVRALVQRHPDVLSTGVRTAAGELLVEAGNHEANWEPLPNSRSTATQWQVPVLRGEEPWGKVEIQFRPVEADGIPGWLGIPGVGLALFLGLVGLVAYTLYLFAALRQFDPVAVIPERVKAVLDSMSESLLILDDRFHIVLANAAAEETLDRPADQLLGRGASALPWMPDRSDGPADELPWVTAICEGTVQRGVTLHLDTSSKGVRALAVSAAPINGGTGSPRGALVTFHDITAVERVNSIMRRPLADLESPCHERDRQPQGLRI